MYLSIYSYFRFPGTASRENPLVWLMDIRSLGYKSLFQQEIVKVLQVRIGGKHEL